MYLMEHLASLSRLLELERGEERRRYELESASLSWEERQARGLALTNLVATDTRSLAGRALLELAPAAGGELVGSIIGAGSLVRLARRGEHAEEPLTGVVARFSRSRLGVAFDVPPPDWAESGKLVLELLPNDVTYERQRAGLRRLASSDEPAHRRWRALLSGERTPAFVPDPAFQPSGHLNREQNEALAHALSATDLALIHGPPGTGKTTVLAELIARAVARGERVLAAAASNMAVDNVLARLVERPGIRVVRIGHVARVSEPLLPWTMEEQVEAHPSQQTAREMLREAHELLQRARKQAARGRSADRFAEAREARAAAGRLFTEARKLMRVTRDQLLASAQVVCATCTGSEVDLLEGQTFDLAVVDEATQATEPSTLLPLLKARRAVLAGDHRQLPPTVLSPEASRAGLSRSLFERLLELHGEPIARMLREQYRMHEAIMAYPSRVLYGGLLRAHPSVAGHLLTDLEGVANTEATRVPLVFLDTAGKGLEDELPPGSESRRNPGEAELVARKVNQLLEAGLAPQQISVIAPYEAQVRALRSLLPMAGLEIDTVDGFQGRENEAVVVSLTRSNRDAEVGFLADIRRMNVAITRARRHLLVVGDSATVSAHPFYRGFIDEVTARGGYRSVWEEPE
jgi:superfamily I DNA and/or RNA helicase